MEQIQGEGSSISFHDLEYKVKVRGGCCRKKDKAILRNIDGLFKPGMNAIMGATGSGKTSLLDVIAGRKDPEGISGQVLVDGNPQPKNFKCMSGYVVQDDVVMGTLTVRENFMFSANVRLPASVSYKEKKKRVNDVINELGLNHCADSKVGTEFIRGVSGGERKRTNIGMELIIAPSVLFLDEPTTGLDSSTSYAVLRLLHRLSRKGKTIVFSIHQPRYSIFKLFDNLMLLSQGLCVYHGPAKDCLDFFSSIGHECEEHNNPADFFLDVVNGDSTAVLGVKDSPSKNSLTSKEPKNDMVLSEGSLTMVNKAGQKNGQMLEIANGKTVNEDEISVDLSAEDDEEIIVNLAEQLNEKYKSSRTYKQMMDEAQPIFEDYDNRVKTGQDIQVTKAQYSTTFCTQLNYVSRRTILNLLRNPMTTVLQLMVSIIFGVIIGLLYYDLEDTAIPGIQNRVGMFFFMIMNQVFSNLSAVELFIRERAIFIHENAAGFYRVSAYFVAKIFCDMIPMRIFPLIIFCSITYFMTGLRMEVDNFFYFFLCLLLVSLVSASIGFFIGSSIGVFAIANLLMALTYVLMMVFGGLFVNISSITVGLRWLQYLSIFRYTLNALSINELKGLEFFVEVNETKILYGTGDQLYLKDQGIAYESAWDFWQNIFAVFCMIIFFLTLTYIQLRRIKKYK